MKQDLSIVLSLHSGNDLTMQKNGYIHSIRDLASQNLSVLQKYADSLY